MDNSQREASAKALRGFDEEAGIELSDRQQEVLSEKHIKDGGSQSTIFSKVSSDLAEAQKYADVKITSLVTFVWLNLLFTLAFIPAFVALDEIKGLDGPVEAVAGALKLMLLLILLLRHCCPCVVDFLNILLRYLLPLDVMYQSVFAIPAMRINENHLSVKFMLWAANDYFSVMVTLLFVF